MRLILASASERRREILEGLGLVFEVVVAGIDETPRSGEEPESLVLRLAQAKAKAVAAAPDTVVLAADTEVVLGGRVLGKPEDAAHARRMLASLQGRTHEVLTGVCLVSPSQERSALSRTEVTLAPMSPEEIDWYVGTGEPMGRAGGYHVVGLGARFIETVSGSPSNVAGLPARIAFHLVREAGVRTAP